MKHAPTFASVVALLWLLWVLVRLPGKEIRSSEIAYLVFQLGLTVTAWWAAQRVALHDARYREFHFVVLAPVLAIGLWIAITHAFAHPKWIAITCLVGAAITATTVFIVLRHYIIQYLGMSVLPFPCLILLVASGVFLACGLVMILALPATSSHVGSLTRRALGIFWLTQGAFGFAFTIGLAHNRIAWLAYNNWVPSIVACLIFSWWAWTLSGWQAEASYALPRPHQQTATDEVYLASQSKGGNAIGRGTTRSDGRDKMS